MNIIENGRGGCTKETSNQPKSRKKQRQPMGNRENPTPEVAVMWSPNTNNDTLSEINFTLKFDYNHN